MPDLEPAARMLQQSPYDHGDTAKIDGGAISGDPRFAPSIRDAVSAANPPVRVTAFASLPEALAACADGHSVAQDRPAFMMIDARRSPERACVDAANLKANMPGIPVLIAGEAAAVRHPSYIRQAFAFGADDLLPGPPWAGPLLVHALHRAAWQCQAASEDGIGEPGRTWGPPPDRQLMAEVGHEMRTPLAAMIGFARSIEQEALGPIDHRPEQYRDYARAIRTSGEHLLTVFDGLLEIGAACALALGAGESVRPLDIVSQAAEWAMPFAAAKNLSLRVACSAAQSATLQDDFVVPGSASLLQQAVVDLVHNAVKFTPPGGHIWLDVALGPSVVITVRDDGMGMDGATLRRLRRARFQPPTPEGEGHGLGLVFVQRVIAAHHGEVALDSVPGQGTTIQLRLPTLRRAYGRAEG